MNLFYILDGPANQFSEQFWLILKPVFWLGGISINLYLYLFLAPFGASKTG